MIRIPEIVGVFTNADKEDIPEKYATALKNFIARFGKLVKTFGFGVKIDTIEASVVNLVTYLNSNLAAGKGSGTGYVIIGVKLAANVVSLRYWDGDSWEDIDDMLENTLGTYKQNQKIPIIQHNKILRILPGAVGEFSGTEAKGLWIGYLDRDFFDGIYEADTDFNSGFWVEDTEIVAPDIETSGFNLTVDQLSTATFKLFGSTGNSINLYYKFSYVYDGLNESLLSDELKVILVDDDDAYPQIAFSITKTSHNKRITAIKVYRSLIGNQGAGGSGSGAESGGLDASYGHIHTIDLLRPSGKYLSGSNADSGRSSIYVRNISGSYAAGHAGLWGIKVTGGAREYNIADPTSLGSGQDVFPIHAIESDIATHHWDTDWVIGYYAGVGYGVGYGEGVWTQVARDADDGCYAGYGCVMFDDEDFGIDSLIGAILFVNSLHYVIERTHTKAIQIDGLYTSDFINQAWKILQATTGQYYFTENGGDVDGLFFDTNLDAGASYPLLNSPSIKVNGKFGLVLKGRLFQYNVVLDPGDTNEEHDDWLSYSEYDQLDVNPVSNVIPIVNREGGEGTGMAVSFGSLILFKKHAILKLDIADPTDPTTWSLLESVFERGNVAYATNGGKDGVVNVGDSVYFCAYDGIYRVDANMMAAADSTPLIKNRISEPINDVYLSLDDATEKIYIKGAFNQRENEIIWRLNVSNVWAYNITTQEWRQINSDNDPDIICLDENGDFMFYDSGQAKVYSANETESVGCEVITKLFRLSELNDREQKVIVRYVKVRYKSIPELTINVYVDEDVETEDNVAVTGTLPNVLAAESLSDPTDLSQATWSPTAEISIVGTDAVYLYVATGSGILAQTSGNLAIAGVGSKWYKLVYTISSSNVVNAIAIITATFASELIYLDISNGTHTVYFYSAVAPGNFVLFVTGATAGETFTLESMSAKKVDDAVIKTTTIPIRYRCQTLKVKIIDSVDSPADTEIYSIEIILGS